MLLKLTNSDNNESFILNSSVVFKMRPVEGGTRIVFNDDDYLPLDVSESLASIWRQIESNHRSK
jgi:hypothetical protein